MANEIVAHLSAVFESLRFKDKSKRSKCAKNAVDMDDDVQSEF